MATSEREIADRQSGTLGTRQTYPRAKAKGDPIGNALGPIRADPQTPDRLDPQYQPRIQ